MISPILATIIIAAIAALPPTLAALAAFRKSKESVAKTDELQLQTKEIHTLTNSNLSKVTSALEVANEKISGLEKLVSEMAKKNDPFPH